MRLISYAMIALVIFWPIAGHPQVTRYLIVGDSWAEEQWLDGSHSRVFADRNLQTVGVSGELTTTSGTTAADWVMPANLARIDAALAEYPHLDTVQLTIGGNDFLDSWNTTFDAAQFDALIEFILADVEVVSEYILAQRPELEIIVSLYDYPNFEDTRNGLIWFGVCSGLWNNLGTPNPQQVNTAAVQVIDSIEGFTDGDPRITHVRHLGQAQRFFGSTMLPLPGDITLPSPAEAMRERFFAGGLDCFHFNATAYDVLINNLVDGYIDARFQSGLVLSLDSPSVEYTGQPQSVSVSTVPGNQTLIVSYDGDLQPPTAVGAYSFIVTAPGWRESLSGQFEILPGSQTIDFSVPNQLFTDAPDLILAASASSSLPVDLELLAGPATLDNGVLILDGIPGVLELRATQPGDGNWQPAEPVTRVIQVVEQIDELFDDRFEQPVTTP